MVVCLYYPDEDYLAAIEQACLSSALISCRIRLFSEEVLWRAAVLDDGFTGVAAASRAALECIPQSKDVKRLVLTDAFAPAAGELSIYEPVDAFNRAIQRRMGTLNPNRESAGLHIVFSFQSCQQQRQAFEALKTQLQRQMPLAALLDLTTFAGVSGKTGEVLSEWLWEGEGATFSEGKCYSLCHAPQDLSAIFLPEFQEKVQEAVTKISHPLWLWSGMDWRETLIKFMPLVKSVSWICDHSREIDTAVKWTEMLKGRQGGIGGFLISGEGSRRQSEIHLEGTFDEQFESLSECVSFIVAGGRR